MKRVYSVQRCLDGAEDGEKLVLVYVLIYCASAGCAGRIYRKTFWISI